MSTTPAETKAQFDKEQLEQLKKTGWIHHTGGYYYYYDGGYYYHYDNFRDPKYNNDLLQAALAGRVDVVKKAAQEQRQAQTQTQNPAVSVTALTLQYDAGNTNNNTATPGTAPGTAMPAGTSLATPSFKPQQ